jgi:hypothetical protein
MEQSERVPVVDVAEMHQGHEVYDIFEGRLDEVITVIADLLESYKVTGWSEPEGRWYRCNSLRLSQHSPSDRIGPALAAAQDFRSFLEALCTASPSLDDPVARKMLADVSA